MMSTHLFRPAMSLLSASRISPARFCTIAAVRSQLLAIVGMLSVLVAPAWAVPINGGLQLWLDGRDTSTMFQETVGPGVTPSVNGGPVGVWRDKSGNSFHAVASGGAATRAVRNDAALNGGTALRLDNVDDQLLVSTLLVTRPYTVIVVDQYNTALQGRTVDAAVNWLVGKHSNANRFYNGSNMVSASAAAVVNVPDIQTNTATLAASAHIFNGTDITNNPTTGVNPGQLRIGTSFAGERSQFDIAELIVYNRAITLAERTITENYLSAKYSGSVVAHLRTITNNRYIGDDNAKGHYDYGVFGIGQATDASIVTTGATDGLSITQNGADPLGLDEWVLAGHTNGPNGVTSADVSGSRWERSWFIDTTGVTTADLSFDWNDAGNTSTFDALYNGLYYRPNNSGPFTLIAVGNVDIANQRVDFLGATLDLNDGYYTLGLIPVPEPATLTLIGLGAIGLAIRTRRRRIAV